MTLVDSSAHRDTKKFLVRLITLRILSVIRKTNSAIENTKKMLLFDQLEQKNLRCNFVIYELIQLHSRILIKTLRKTLRLIK